MRLLKHVCVLFALLLLLIVRGFSEDPPNLPNVEAADSSVEAVLSHVERGVPEKRSMSALQWESSPMLLLQVGTVRP